MVLNKSSVCNLDEVKLLEDMFLDCVLSPNNQLCFCKV